MIEHDSETPRVSSLLQIHYDKRFIPVAQCFVESPAAATGISPESTQRLCLLVEESLAFIRVDRQGFAMVYLESLGADWFEATTKELMALIAAGIEAIAVYISTTTPQPPDMETQLASIRLLFSGIHMTALDSLHLVYCLTIKPINFEIIQLALVNSGSVLSLFP